MTNFNFNDLNQCHPLVKSELIIQLLSRIQQDEQQINRIDFSSSVNLLQRQDAKWGEIIKNHNILNMKDLIELIFEQSKSLDKVQIKQAEIYNIIYNILENIQNNTIAYRDNLSYLGELLEGYRKNIDNNRKAINAEVNYNDIIAEWRNLEKNKYIKFPWLIQVLVLARYIFSSAVSLKDDNSNYRERLINDIQNDIPNNKLPDHFFSLSKLLDVSISPIINNPSNRERETISYSIINVPQQEDWKSTFESWKNTPNLFVIGATLISAIQGNANIQDTSDKAISFCDSKNIFVSSETTKNHFITTVVDETATHYKAIAKKYPVLDSTAD
jgi:hypothetical protein